jgi:hypothetical protein
VDLVPIEILSRRGTLESTLRHEFVHVLTDAELAGRPLWVREGLAMVMAGEASLSTDPSAGAVEPGRRCPTDREMRAPRSAEAWRAAYEAAGRCVARALGRGIGWRDLR